MGLAFGVQMDSGDRNSRVFITEGFSNCGHGLEENK